MRKRRIVIFLIPLLIMAGIGWFLYRYSENRTGWATSPYNRGLYPDGELAVGSIYDRNGICLSRVEDGERVFSNDELIRYATAHATGDIYGNIGTGALKVFAEEMTGYNLLTGTRDGGGEVYLTIDAELNKVAYEALGDYSGCVAVCNYETSEILCMVSTPGCDPADPSAADGSGAYMNRFLSSTYTPGSVFKIVTLAAAMNEIPDIMEREFECTGSIMVEGSPVNCHSVHGKVKIEDAFAGSCNCVFGELAMELGGEKLAEYAKILGLTDSFEIDGITAKAGNFTVSENQRYTAWSGTGQYKDLVNPAAMLRLMCVIANGGEASELTLKRAEEASVLETWIDSFTEEEEEPPEMILDKEIADDISAMMNYNVYSSYGAENFPGLELHAKSGTAEVGDNAKPHSWFVGFTSNDDLPLAFVVVAENGGSGASTAGVIANTVLQSAAAKQE